MTIAHRTLSTWPQLRCSSSHAQLIHSVHVILFSLLFMKGKWIDISVSTIYFLLGQTAILWWVAHLLPELRFVFWCCNFRKTSQILSLGQCQLWHTVTHYSASLCPSLSHLISNYISLCSYPKAEVQWGQDVTSPKNSHYWNWSMRVWWCIAMWDFTWVHGA